MSTLDPEDGLTDQQRVVFDKYTAVCARSFYQLSVDKQRGCTDHMATLGNMNRARKLRQDMLGQLQIVQTRLEEIAMVNEWLDRWQTQASIMLSSFINASYAYDMILGLKSTKSVPYNLVLELAVNFLPEIKPLQRAFKLFARKHPSGSDDVMEALEMIGVKVTKVPGSFELLDRRSKDLTNMGRGWAKSGGGNVLDEASIRLKSGYQAKNTIFGDMINTAMEDLLAVTGVVQPLDQKILSSTISKQQLTDEINKTGLGDPGPILDAKSYELLAKQLLYAMLKGYIQGYCKILDVHVASGIDRFDWREIDGLDKNAAPEIFKRFSSKAGWKGDKNYPPIEDEDDMAKKWGLKIERDDRFEYSMMGP